MGPAFLIALTLSQVSQASWISPDFGGAEAPERRAMAAMERTGIDPGAVVVKIERCFIAVGRLAHGQGKPSIDRRIVGIIGLWLVLLAIPFLASL